jgi:hypothetical protein
MMKPQNTFSNRTEEVAWIDNKRRRDWKSKGGLKKRDNDGKRDRDNERECFRCGSNRHNGDSPECKAMNATCLKCNFKGHYQRKCRSKRTREFSQGDRDSKRAKTVNKIQEDDSDWEENLPQKPSASMNEKVNN